MAMNSDMRISEAIASYKAHGDQYYGQAIREAMNTLAEIESTEPLHNDSYVDALFLTDIMLQRTYRTMDVLTGNCVDQFFDVLSTNFVNALDRIKNMKDGLARFIILDSDGKVPAFLQKFINAGYPIKIHFAKSVPDAKVSHLIVCDKKMVRDEEYHDELVDIENIPASAIRADVYLNSPIDARIKTDYFDGLWKFLEKADNGSEDVAGGERK
jgi:hypothetical protein